MSNHHLRLRTIEVALAPAQIVLVWLEGARGGDFMDAGLCCSEPHAYIEIAVSKAISIATKGMDRNVAQQVNQEAQQRAGSLYLLIVTINVAVLDCCQEARARSVIMFGYLRTMLQVPKSERLDVLLGLRSSLLLGFENLLIIADSLTTISREDFDGHKLLFNDARSMFEEQHRALRLLCQGFDILAVEQEELPIDLDLVRSVLENDVTELISRWRDLARLEMLARFGERGMFRTEALRALKDNQHLKNVARRFEGKALN
jgi:hypothetical protein